MLALLLAAVFTVTPEVKQGEVIRVESDGGGMLVARLGERIVRLFEKPEGGLLGLMPVAVDHAPGAATLSVMDASGAVLHTAEVSILDARFPVQNVRATAAMRALQPMPGEMETVREVSRMVSEERYWAEPLRLPVRGCLISPFGVQRYHNGQPTGNYHRGIDQRAAEGRAVRAPAAGVVRIARMYRLHGGTVGLDHGHGVVSIHIHMSKLSVKRGQRVEAGQVIGLAGSTGFATGPHLHWSLYVNGLPVNPLPWLPALQPCR